MTVTASGWSAHVLFDRKWGDSGSSSPGIVQLCTRHIAQERNYLFNTWNVRWVWMSSVDGTGRSLCRPRRNYAKSFFDIRNLNALLKLTRLQTRIDDVISNAVHVSQTCPDYLGNTMNTKWTLNPIRGSRFSRIHNLCGSRSAIVSAPYLISKM